MKGQKESYEIIAILTLFLTINIVILSITLYKKSEKVVNQIKQVVNSQTSSANSANAEAICMNNN